MNIGERIKARRLERGMTLEEVAKIVKVTRGTIQKMGHFFQYLPNGLEHFIRKVR